MLKIANMAKLILQHRIHQVRTNDNTGQPMKNQTQSEMHLEGLSMTGKITRCINV